MTTLFGGPGAPARMRRRRTPRSAVPHRRGPDPLVDAAAALSLSVLAVAGLHHVYSNWAYLVVGLLGAGLATGVVLALRGAGAHDPLVAVIALLLAFPVGAGIAMVTGPVPTPEALGMLFGGLEDGWKNLLTTAPPIGISGGFGVVPYTMGFVVAGAGLVLARHTSSPLLPAVPALGSLVLGFLLGTAEVVSVLVQGAAVLAIVLAWGAVRGNRPRRTAGPPHWNRLLSGVAMLAAVTVVGLVVGPRLPFADRGTRVHLRQLFEPPFNPRRDPSPLAGYHGYVVPPANGDVVLTATGLPPGARIRLATLDTYDGQVWKVGGEEAPTSGRFEKVGEAILPVPPGVPATVTVTVERDRSDMWMPTVGATRAVRFEGERARLLTDSFRYNRTTRSAAAPDRLRAGDRFTLDAQLPEPVDEELARTRAALNADLLPPLPVLPETLTRRATALTVDATSPYDKARMLATKLRDGTGGMPTYYSDGGEGTESSAAASASGHSVARLVRFVDARAGLVGNAEQYAATMALMARHLGLPAQVVMGFRPPPETAGAEVVTVRSGDVDAWVEIAFDGLGWLAFDPTPPRDRRPDESPKTSQREVDLSQQQPPPPTYLQVPESLPDLVVRPPEPAPPPESPLEVAGNLFRFLGVLTLPMGLVLAVVVLIVGAKVLRARRRRHRGPPVQRLAGAWWEVCDRARDLGAPIPLRATRLEIARTIAPVYPGAPPLAVRIDEAMFAAPLPSEEEVVAIWEKLDAEHQKLLQRLTVAQRVQAALSLASLRPRRWFRAPPPMPPLPPPPASTVPPAPAPAREPALR